MEEDPFEYEETPFMEEDGEDSGKKGNHPKPENHDAKKQLNNKVKVRKQIKVKFLIPIYKYYHPLKQIYFMDMIFPLDIRHATEDDFHVGKLNLIKNVQIRPLVRYNKKTGYTSITYDSPTIHVLHNQCDYYVDYLNSLGDEELKKLSDILNGWKNLWSKKDIFEIDSKITIREDYKEDDNDTEATEPEECFINSPDGKLPTRQTVLKKLYYFERLVTYNNQRIILNRFTIYYSSELLQLLNLDKEVFFNQVLYYKHPIVIKPRNTLEYRINLLSQLLKGDHPRLKTEIIFESDQSSIVMDPFLSTQRTFAVNQDTIMVRCGFSYVDKTDLKYVKIEKLASENEFDSFAKKQSENVSKKLKSLLNA